MRALVVYYSLTGTTRRVAGALAKELSADVEDIRCARYRTGFPGVLRCGMDSWMGRLPAIGAPRQDLSEFDVIVVGGPIWSFHAATPVRAYLKKVANRLPAVAFFLTHGGSSPAQAFREMQACARISADGDACRPRSRRERREVRTGRIGLFVARLRARQAN